MRKEIELVATHRCGRRGDPPAVARFVHAVHALRSLVDDGYCMMTWLPFSLGDVSRIPAKMSLLVAHHKLICDPAVRQNVNLPSARK